MSGKILVVDDEKSIRDALAFVLREEGYRVSEALDGTEAIDKVKKEHFDLVLCDLIMPGAGGLEVLKSVRESSPATLLAIISAYGSIKNAVEAIKQGAVDYITKPFIFDQVILIVKKIFEERRLARLNIVLKEELKKQQCYGRMIGVSPYMQAVFALIEKIAFTDSNVLLTGKSGTGKEVVARTIHEKGPRADGPFLPINCAAVPAELIESELFGFLQGSFTGAHQNREGFFKIAEGGTLFMDEICSVPIYLQAKLLRAIETKEIIPIGRRGPEKVDVRIIAATNKNLEEEVAGNRFREDLYYRLKVIEIALPQLRERREDIPLLVEHFICNYNEKFNKNVIGVEPAVMDKFLNWEWKGNIRELENVIERAMIMCERESISLKDLFYGLNGDLLPHNGPDLALKEAVRRFEKEHIQNTLGKVEMDKKKAASILNLSLSSLYRKMEELGIEVKISQK